MCIRDSLLEEGIRQTEAFASLTGFDEENIMLSLYAASQSKAKLITKVNKIAFENVINSLNQMCIRDRVCSRSGSVKAGDMKRPMGRALRRY